jgi:hypothetical protein
MKEVGRRYEGEYKEVPESQEAVKTGREKQMPGKGACRILFLLPAV